MVHVPYRGVVPAFTDLLAGQVAMISASPVELKPYLESGRIKPLAVTSSERSKQLPNVPTVAETLKSPPVVTYNGLLAPRGTPVEIVAAVARALRNGVEFQDRLAQVGTDPFVSTPDDFAKIIAADIVQWRDIVRDLNLKTQ
jgi:tripartite-type tricarboxylate transporter receptor subunit TctC